MDKKFAERLDEFLDSECDDYGISYSWKWDEDIESCIVTLERNTNDFIIDVEFRFDGKSLSIEMGDENWYEIAEYDYTVKYFWMLVSPILFK